MTETLGRADSITVVGDEDGFELHISTDRGEYVVNVHSVTHDLIKVGEEMQTYWAEGRALAGQHQRDLDSAASQITEGLTEYVREATGRDDLTVEFNTDAYDPSDPKHPGWSTRVADAYDTMRGDR